MQFSCRIIIRFGIKVGTKIGFFSFILTTGFAQPLRHIDRQVPHQCCPIPFLPEVSSVYQSRDSNPRPDGQIKIFIVFYIYNQMLNTKVISPANQNFHCILYLQSNYSNYENYSWNYRIRWDNKGIKSCHHIFAGKYKLDVA